VTSSGVDPLSCSRGASDRTRESTPLPSLFEGVAGRSQNSASPPATWIAGTSPQPALPRVHCWSVSPTGAETAPTRRHGRGHPRPNSTVSRAFPGGGTSVFLFSSPLLAVLAIWRLLILSDCRISGGVCIASARTAVSAGATASIPLSKTGETMVPIPRGGGRRPRALAGLVGFDVEYAAFF